jgi:phospholipid/cholesterol/gamma-HCH transport system ATP-binding protein
MARRFRYFFRALRPEVLPIPMSAPVPSPNASVVLRDVSLAFGQRRVFEGLSCTFPAGRISVILGGSGSGKSTVLRMIGRLQRPDAGTIEVADSEITHLSDRRMNEVRSRLGMMFQGGALLDSLTVFDNVALPLRERGMRGDVTAEVQRRLEAVGLRDAGPLLPSQLSGGMVKRVALARALVGNPSIVLCDEPFSGLDPVNVRRVEALLGRLARELGITLIVTSHHIASSRRMAQQIVFLQDRRAVVGTAAELEASDDHRIADFFRADGDGAFALREGEAA